MYPYYRTAGKAWHNAIHKSISTKECFIKCGQRHLGRGFYWYIHPSCIDMFRSGDFNSPRTFSKNTMTPADDTAITHDANSVAKLPSDQQNMSPDSQSNNRESSPGGNKRKKPRSPYISLIAKAMLASGKTKLTLNEICEQVRQRTYLVIPF